MQAFHSCIFIGWQAGLVPEDASKTEQMLRHASINLVKGGVLTQFWCTKRCWEINKNRISNIFQQCLRLNGQVRFVFCSFCGNFVTKGELKIFTPMYYVLAEKLWNANASDCRPKAMAVEFATKQASLFQLERLSTMLFAKCIFARILTDTPFSTVSPFVFAPVYGGFNGTQGLTRRQCTASKTLFPSLRCHALKGCGSDMQLISGAGVASSMLHCASSIVGHRATEHGASFVWSRCVHDWLTFCSIDFFLIVEIKASQNQVT